LHTVLEQAHDWWQFESRFARPEDELGDCCAVSWGLIEPHGDAFADRELAPNAELTAGSAARMYFRVVNRDRFPRLYLRAYRVRADRKLVHWQEHPHTGVCVTTEQAQYIGDQSRGHGRGISRRLESCPQLSGTGDGAARGGELGERVGAGDGAAGRGAAAGDGAGGAAGVASGGDPAAVPGADREVSTRMAGDRVKAGDPVVDVIMPEVVAAAASYRGALLRGEVQAARRDKLRGLREEGLVGEAAVFDVASKTAETEQQALLAAATLRAAGIDPGRARPADAAGEPAQPDRRGAARARGTARGGGGGAGSAGGGDRGGGAGAGGGEVPARAAGGLRDALRGGRRGGVAAEPDAGGAGDRGGRRGERAVVRTADERLAFAGLRGAVECVSDDPSVVQVPATAIGRVGESLVVYRREDATVTGGAGGAADVVGGVGAGAGERGRGAAGGDAGGRGRGGAGAGPGGEAGGDAGRDALRDGARAEVVR
jgi:hypothetical protein